MKGDGCDYIEWGIKREGDGRWSNIKKGTVNEGFD